MANPSGICFNPVSVLHTIKSAIVADSLPESEIIQSQGLWCHHDFHGSFCHSDKSTCLQNINQQIQKTHSFLKNIDRVIITVGTAYVYSLDGHIVNNCHKRPQSLFERRRLTQSEIKNALQQTIQMLDNYSSQPVEYIITLSPVRHLKDGMVNNNISKSTCLLAIHDLVDTFSHVHYFPAYELLMDDLRDYRFYKSDRIHPSEEAVEYVFQNFEKVHLYENDAALRNKIFKIDQGLSHRPFNSQTEQHIAFKNELVEKMSRLEKEYDFLDFTNEIESLRT